VIEDEFWRKNNILCILAKWGGDHVNTKLESSFEMGYCMSDVCICATIGKLNKRRKIEDKIVERAYHEQTNTYLVRNWNNNVSQSDNLMSLIVFLMNEREK